MNGVMVCVWVNLKLDTLLFHLKRTLIICANNNIIRQRAWEGEWERLFDYYWKGNGNELQSLLNLLCLHRKCPNHLWPAKKKWFIIIHAFAVIQTIINKRTIIGSMTYNNNINSDSVYFHPYVFSHIQHKEKRRNFFVPIQINTQSVWTMC